MKHDSMQLEVVVMDEYMYIDTIGILDTEM